MIHVNGEGTEYVTFSGYMAMLDAALNKAAAENPGDFKRHGGKMLENDVYEHALEAAKGTIFENQIELVSGAKFPDIVARRDYGIEVKSTLRDEWTSIGSSILESTRIKTVKRIFLTFGKLGGDVAFLSRPYEECLPEIAVTHYPRYRIDMKTEGGNTIFDKIGVSYDVLRKMDDPVGPVSSYYQGNLRPGESLWWAPTTGGQSTRPTVRLMDVVTAEEKKEFRKYALAHFPELFTARTDKFYRLSLWLAVNKGVVDNHVRDLLSAGGRQDRMGFLGKKRNVARIYGHLADLIGGVALEITAGDRNALSNDWKMRIVGDGIDQYFAILCGQLLRARLAGKIDEEEFEGTIDVLKKAYYDVLPCNRVFPERRHWIGLAERGLGVQ